MVYDVGSAQAKVAAGDPKRDRSCQHDNRHCVLDRDLHADHWAYEADGREL